MKSIKPGFERGTYFLIVERSTTKPRTQFFSNRLSRQYQTLTTKLFCHWRNSFFLNIIVYRIEQQRNALF